MTEVLTVNITKRIDLPCEYIGIAQTGLIALQYLYLWLFADTEDAYKVYSMAILMGFEFIMLHSGVFMATVPRKYSILVFFPVYGLFAYAFHRMMREGDNVIMVIYLTTVLNRMRFAFFNADQEMKNRAGMLSIIAITGYFFLLLAVVIGSSFVPAFALGQSFTSSDVYREVATSGGVFTDKPYTAICLGFLYYSMLSYVNYRMVRGKS